MNKYYSAFQFITKNLCKKKCFDLGTTKADQIIQRLTESLQKNQQIELPYQEASNQVQDLANRQQKNHIVSQLNGDQLLQQIILDEPNYRTFRKHNLNLAKINYLLEKFAVKIIKKNTNNYQNRSDISIMTRALFLNNLLTYTRKLFGKSLIKSKQNHIQQIIDLLTYQSVYDTQIIPSLIKNIEFTYQPEIYLDQASAIVLQNAAIMKIGELSNSLYTISKIARKRMQDNSNPITSAAIDKNILYNSAQLTMIGIIPILLLKKWTEITPLVECLIAYQRIELTDTQNIGFFLIDQIKNVLKNHSNFDFIFSQLTHTLMKYVENPIGSEEREIIIQLQRILFTNFINNIHSLTLNSISLSMYAFNKLDSSLITNELVEKSQQLYCEKETQANIQDLAMSLNLCLSKQILEIILPEYSKIITQHYDMLKNNVDINIINIITPNISSSINKKHLEKKFINQYLISIKILKDNGKLNQKFVKQFIMESNNIENEEIKIKFDKIKFLLTHQRVERGKQADPPGKGVIQY